MMSIICKYYIGHFPPEYLKSTVPNEVFSRFKMITVVKCLLKCDVTAFSCDAPVGKS